ncbi:unnamed protein product [Arctia plantaginis]|uniref:Uncharacterized protein n=1 Tax=Arctia plantaginis TaxID=874455 RepID=A0A8S1AP20_ARCPL|nr:unnamed protein product [Arctia plantaginis]
MLCGVTAMRENIRTRMEHQGCGLQHARREHKVCVIGTAVRNITVVGPALVDRNNAGVFFQHMKVSISTRCVLFSSEGVQK